MKMFDCDKTINAFKYLKECEESLKLPQTPYKDYYIKCVKLLEKEMFYLCGMVSYLLEERGKKTK